MAFLGDQYILVPQPSENTVEATSVIVVDWVEFQELSQKTNRVFVGF